MIYRSRLQWLGATAALLVVVLVACTSAGRTGPEVTTTVSEPIATTSSTVVSTTAGSVSSTTSTLEYTGPTIPGEVEDAFLDWDVIAGLETMIGPPAAFNGSVLAKEEGGNPEMLGVSELDMGRRIITHTVPPQDAEGGEWLLDDMESSSSWVVVAEHQERRWDYHIWVYSLEDGSRRLITSWDEDIEWHTIPQISLDGDRLAWNETKSDGRTCVNIADLSTDQPPVSVVCTPDEQLLIAWPHLRWPNLAYVQYTAGDDSPCHDFQTLDLSTGISSTHDNRECWAYQGVATGGWAVWFESAPYTGAVFRSPVYASVDGKVIPLGIGAVGSLSICAGRAYWRFDGRDHKEIRSWAPGTPVTVVYRSPEDKKPTTTPKCAADWITIERAFTGVGPSTNEVLTARP